MDWTQLPQIILHFDQHLPSAIAQHGTAVYAILFAILFFQLGTVPLFFLPGNPLLFFCGAAGATGAIDVRIVIPLLITATVAGSTLNYWTGRVIGHRIYTHPYRWVDRKALQRTHSFYEAHGGLTFLMSPFIGVVRTLAPLVAGVAQMAFAHFLRSVLAGAAVWVLVCVTGGYLFGNVPVIREHMGSIVLGGVGLGVGALVAGLLWRLVCSGRMSD